MKQPIHTMIDPVIMVDPGHGGRDSGAVGPGGLREADVVLGVALLLEARLRRWASPMMTRRDDEFVELSERAAMANRAGAAAMVSIHANSAKQPARGIETFHFTGSAEGKALAGCVQGSLMMSFPGHVDRGEKGAGFAVLRQTKCVAVLVELEFIHTAEGEKFLGNRAVWDGLAEAIDGGLGGYFGRVSTPHGLEVEMPPAPGGVKLAAIKLLYDTIALLGREDKR